MTHGSARAGAGATRFPRVSPAAVLGAAAVGVGLWATAIEPQLFTLRRHTLPMLPQGSAPLRVLQLSDLHLAPWHHRKIEWVRRLAELRPDLVVLTGDLMGHRAARGPLLHALHPFAAAGVPGVFVHGSNDYYGPIFKNPMKYLLSPSRLSTRRKDLDNAALTRGLRDEIGFVDLNNSAAHLELRGVHLELFGLNDPHIRYHNAAKMRAALAETRAAQSASRQASTSGSAESPAESAAAAGTVPDQGPARIGVVHAPYQEALGDLLDESAQLILAGHTHGGQVRVPGVGALTANCDLPVRQARGLSAWYDAEHAAFLNVSAGMGASIYAPIRFACRPEASLLTLEAARD